MDARERTELVVALDEQGVVRAIELQTGRVGLRDQLAGIVGD